MALDDYAGLGILTLAAPLTPDMAQLEAGLLLSSYYAALGAMRTDTGLNALVVRCIARIPDASGQEEEVMIFRAAVARDAVQKWAKSKKVPTPQQIQNEILQGIWWDHRALTRYLEALARQNELPR